jgi:hypothetical protein
MKILKTILKLFAASVVLTAVVIGAIAVYMHFYGNSLVRKALGELTGSQVQFKSVALNLGRAAASFRGVTVAGQIGFGKNVFDADTLTIGLNRERLEKEKKIVFDSVYMKGAKLRIIRNRAGVLNISLPNVNTARLREPVFGSGAIAYADETAAKNPLYDLFNGIRHVRIEDSSVSFEDSYGMDKPYSIWCDKLYAEITSRQTGAGYLSVAAVSSLVVPQSRKGNGWFGMKASMAVYPDVTDVEMTAETGNIELAIFMPYFKRNTPFYFRSGRFNSKTDFRMHRRQIDSLTTMQIDDMSLRINPYDPNAEFLNVSIDRLAPYLMSGNNIAFDFVVTGPISNPHVGVGPKVKFAIGMAAMEGVARAMGQIQRMR